VPDARAPANTERPAGGAENTDVAGLVTAAADGDKVAWRGIVERFSGLVWSITRAYRLADADAADAFQTTWLRLAEHIGRIQHPERVGAWLATAARRECLQNIRAGARAIPAADMTRFEPVTVGGDPAEPEAAVLRAEREQEDAERAAALWRAFERLSARCRELLRVLMAVPPPSYGEVAAALEIPIGSIGPTRARCLQRLRAELGEGITNPAAPS
jgi:RNA polymerase sigma factor (sigma-70 family)